MCGLARHYRRKGNGEKDAAALTGDDLEVASHQAQQVQGEVRHVHRTRSRS